MKQYRGTSLAWALLGLMQDRVSEEKDEAERRKAYLELAGAYELLAGEQSHLAQKYKTLGEKEKNARIAAEKSREEVLATDHIQKRPVHS